MKTRWIALIPAYEPTELLCQLLEQAKQAGFELIVVDDGSSPAAKPIFAQASQYATVLQHEQNRGKGCALKNGFTYIRNNYPASSIVVTLDADGQHRITDAQRICRTAEQHPDALVLGSRMFKENVPLRSLLGNTTTRLVYHITTGQKVQDTQTGLRACSARLLDTLLEIPGQRYEYEMNVLLYCSKAGIPIREVEIETIYIDDNAGSHFDTVKDSCRIYKEILKFSASSLTSFCLDYGLYSILSALTSSIVASNILARVVSASVNYTMNRRLVFKSQSHVVQSAVQYAVLASLILLGNTVVLSLLIHSLGMNRYLAKLLTEILFFCTSWLVQRKIIFRTKKPIEGKG